MNKKILILTTLGIFVLAIAVLLAQNMFNNQESVIKPEPVVVNNPATNWKQYSFDKIGLSFLAPTDMVVNGEMADDTTFTLTVQRSAFPNQDYYQLYGLYQLTDSSEIDDENLKSQLNADSIIQKEISGFKAIQGQYKGERNRLVTIIITNKGLFTLATSQPTDENGKLTDEILNTFIFK